MPSKPLAIGEIVDRMHALREEKRGYDAKSEAVKAEIESLEEELIRRMDTDKLELVRGGKASGAINETVMARVEDFDKFAAWVMRNKALYMLERRVSQGAYRELLNSKPKGIPGLTSFTKRTISLRSL